MRQEAAQPQAFTLFLAECCRLVQPCIVQDIISLFFKRWLQSYILSLLLFSLRADFSTGRVLFYCPAVLILILWWVWSVCVSSLLLQHFGLIPAIAQAPPPGSFPGCGIPGP